MVVETLGTDIAVAPSGVNMSRRMVRAAWAMPTFKIGVFILVALALMAILWPEFSANSATKISVRERFLPPVFLEGGSWAHILGTDQLGRDLLLRSLIGLRNALAIGVASVIIMFVLGCAIGVISGYKGGWVDIVLMRITDAQLSIPIIILAITILGITRATAFTVIAVLVLAGWPIYARVARSVTLAERRREYVRGETILGASDLRIMVIMIAPNILPPIAFVAVLDVARMMIFEAIFGFIGIGIQPPTPTFGNIIADGTKYLINNWWIPTLPGVLLVVALTSINLMGAALERARNQIFKGIL